MSDGELVLYCNDVMPGCPAEARGRSEDEVLAVAAGHAKADHGIQEIDATTLAAVRAAMRS